MLGGTTCVKLVKEYLSFTYRTSLIFSQKEIISSEGTNHCTSGEASNVAKGHDFCECSEQGKINKYLLEMRVYGYRFLLIILN